MAYDIPPHFHAALNPRELPARRVEGLRALHAELVTDQGLLQAASWLPSTWPHLLQLLADMHPDVRAAAAQLLGHLGAALAGGREPRLAGRMPPTALLDWALAVLPPSSTLPAAQRMTVETKDAALTALYGCVAALPPPAVAPFAQPLLRLTMGLLEATTTPPRLLGPLLRLLLAALPAVPLAALGQSFSDLADLLCGWALEPLVAPDDRRLISLVLHALRAQWHSHPDLTASLTDNMLNDAQAAAAATTAAVASANASADGGGSGSATEAARAQAAACMHLVELLCDIVSASSLRQLQQLLPGMTPKGQTASQAQTAQKNGNQHCDSQQQQPLLVGQQPRNQPQPLHPHLHLCGQQHVTQPRAQVRMAAPAPPHQTMPYAPNAQSQPGPHPYLHHNHQYHAQQQGQYYNQNHHQQAATADPTAAVAPPALPSNILALTAMLPTRPGISTVRHLVDLYPRLLSTLKEVRDSVSSLRTEPQPQKAGGGRGEAAGDPWVSRLCRCVEVLAESVASCALGIDPRDVDEVWEGLGPSVSERLASMSLRDDVVPVRATEPGGSSSNSIRTGTSFEGTYGAVGGALAAASVSNPGVADSVGVGGGSSSSNNSDGVSVCSSSSGLVMPPLGAGDGLRKGAVAGPEEAVPSVLGQQGRAAALRTWALQAALEWALSLLTGMPYGSSGGQSSSGGGDVAFMGPAGADADQLLACVLRLLRLATEQDPRVGGRLLAALVLGLSGERGVCRLRSSPRIASVAAAAKILHGLLADGTPALADPVLDWLLTDLSSGLGLGPPGGRPEPLAGRDKEARDAANLGAMVAFDCAILQAACQRGLIPYAGLLRMESLIWHALHGAPCSSSVSPNAAATKPNPPPAPSNAGPEVTPLAPKPLSAADASTRSVSQLAAGSAPSSAPSGAPMVELRDGASTPPISAPPSLPSPARALAPSVTAALCDVWSAAAVALLLAAASTAPRPDTPAPSSASSASLMAVPAAGSDPSAREPRLQAATPTPHPVAASSPDAATARASALRAGCTAYLHALHSLQQDADVGMQLRVVAALRRLLTQPPAAPCAAAATAAGGAGGALLRGERLFRLAMEVVANGAASTDAGVRAAAVDCGAVLVTSVLQASVGPWASEPVGAPGAAIGGGLKATNGDARQWQVASSLPPPRPESFAPAMALALDALTNAAPEVAAAAARLAAALAEAALLASLRGLASASYGMWIPTWQDELAAAPACRAPRPAQVVRLLELVFQSAAAQGSVLLRKRTPAAGCPGHGEDGDAGSRLEALQRLALSMVPAAEAAPGGGDGAAAGARGDGVGGAGGGAAAAYGVARSGSALVWLAVQEGTKQLVASRLRTHLGGPTQTLGGLERMLQVTLSRLAQERREAGPAGVSAASREAAWLALELAGGLERAVAHAAEGHTGGETLPQPVLAFFAANKKVCEEWFTRTREMLARIASLASVHHHAVHHGLLRLRDLRGAMRQLLGNLAKERTASAAAAAGAAAAASPATTLAPPDAKATGGEGVNSAGTAGAAAAAAATLEGAQAKQGAARQYGTKQLQRRAGGGVGVTTPTQQQPQQQPAATAAATAAAGPAAAGAPGPGDGTSGTAAAPTSTASVVQQLETNLSRLALAVVDLLKLVGAAMLALGEADSLQGLHTWAAREFDPLLQGAHLPGASAVAAATAAAAADELSAATPGAGAAGPPSGPSSRRRPEAWRAARSGSKQHKDAFAWLLGMSLQAAGSYEQALLSYNAFLAPAPPPAAAAAAGGSGPALGTSATLELAAAAQAFVVERVGECYAALSDWSGLQGLMDAFSRTTAAEPAVAGWWPATLASIEYRFRALATYDTAPAGAQGSAQHGETAAPGDPTTAVLLAGLRALEAGPRATAAPSPPQPPAPGVRQATGHELGRLMERLCATALAEPAAQRELLLQTCCLRSAARALDATAQAAAATPAASGAALPPATAADGPWSALLLPQQPQPQSQIRAGAVAPGPAFGCGYGRVLLSPEGGTLQAGVVRDVAVTSALFRAARAGDPRVTLPGTHALALEHIRGAAATGNWSLATRLVQAAAARAPAGEAEGGPVGCAGGGRAVLSVAHSLMSAAAGRLQPAQVVELQLRALMPHLLGQQAQPQQRHMPLAPPPPPPLRAAGVDADDLACALCTLARWMLKSSSGPAALVAHGAQQQQHPPRLVAADALAQRQPGQGTLGTAGQQQQQHRGATASAPQYPGGGGSGSSGTTARVVPPGFLGAPAAAARGGPVPVISAPGLAATTPLPWMAAADWPALSSKLLAQLASQYGQGAGPAMGAAAVPPAAPTEPAFAVPNALLQACHGPAVCCLRAVQLAPASARAWRAWADLIYRATKEQRARTGRTAATTPTGATATPQPAAATDGGPGGAAAEEGLGPGPAAAAAAGYGAAAAAYCRYLALSYNQAGSTRMEEVLPVLLQVLHIIVRHAGPMERLLAAQLAAVPPLAWAAVTPQLLAQLPGASGAARQLLGALLHAVGRTAPSLVLYPAVVEVRAADAAAAAADAGGGDGAAAAVAAEARFCSSMVPELRALLADLGRSRPGLLAGVETMVAELERLTVLPDERWAALLAEVEVEISRRAVSLQAEAARVADDASLTPDQRQALLAGRYSTLMAPAVLLLERQLRATAAAPPQTPHERHFAAAVLPRLRAAAAALRDGAGVRDWAKPHQAWAPLRAAAAALARQQRQPLPPMADLSPRLAALQDSEVPMPGCNDDDGAAAAAAGGGGAEGNGGGAMAASVVTGLSTVTVAGVLDEVVALSTKTRPKRVALMGSDGRTYTYLLKGREDLRMDERLMQVLRAINSMLHADPGAAARDLATVRHYSVTPLGPRAGLIQWVPATTSLFAVFRHWQSATLARHGAMVAARQEGVAKSLAEGTAPPPEVEPPPPAAVSRPMDLFYATLVPALQERGLSSATPRRNWPADLLRSVFATLAASAPRQLLARVLWAGGGSAALSWRRQQRYSRSLGVMSCVAHLLGLGDRHPDNILLEGREAGVVHIDYNVCWDKGAKLRVPEVVPFRLTQMLSTALGVGGLEGTFRGACEATLAALRRRREALVGLVDAVLSDPGVDWAVEREDLAARQDMELAVALNLFVSRAEEAQRQLHRAAEELPAVVEGPLALVLSYAEAQLFAETMRSAAAEAQQRIQQAKAALESAGRAEAEARAIVAAAAQEAASLAAEANSLSAAVPQLLQQCAAWAQQHTGTLGVLRDGSFLEGTQASSASWRAIESGCAFGLLAPVAGPGHTPLNAVAPLAALPAVVGGDGLVLQQLPEELVASCHDCDRQAADLLTRREAALAEAIAALTQYGTIVRKLLSPSYPASSYHHRWAQALAALAAGGLAMPAVAQAQALAPREPAPMAVAAAWQALRGAHRLASAAAIVLAPGSAEALAAATGAGSRVPGRELVPGVAAAARGLAEVQAAAVAGAQARQVAAAARGERPGALLAPEALTREVVRVLQGRQVPAPPALVPYHGGAAAGRAIDAFGRGSFSAGGVVVALAAALRQLVRETEGRVRGLAMARSLASRPSRNAAGVASAAAGLAPPPEAPAANAGAGAAAAAAALADYARLGGDLTGLAAAATAVATADARLAVAVFGSLAVKLPDAAGGPGGSSPHASSRTGTPGMHHLGAAGRPLGACGATSACCPLPWLAAAADAFAKWPELQQRLACDVVPELAGQLQMGSGGGGAAGGMSETMSLAQAAADLHALMHTIDDALQSGRECHSRLEALEQLMANYHERHAELSYMLGTAASGCLGQQPPPPLPPQLSPPERSALEADLQALEAAWASRESVAAGLTAAVAMATEALAETVRRFYASVLGAGRMPPELAAFDGLAAGGGYVSVAAAAGGGAWSEAGDGGHAAWASLTTWWEAVTTALEGLQQGERLQPADGAEALAVAPSVSYAAGGSDAARRELPPAMRPLWRCVEVVRLVEQSVRACQGLRLAAPPGTDGALTEAYGTVLPLLARQAAEHSSAWMLPYIQYHLSTLATHLKSVEQQGQQQHEGHGGVAVGDAYSSLVAGTPDLVPFTDFDPRVAGEGELLGGLEDDEDEEQGLLVETESGAGGAWKGCNGGLGGDSGSIGGGDEDGDDFGDLDLGLDLDLDDGFGGGGDDGADDGGGDEDYLDTAAVTTTTVGGDDKGSRGNAGTADVDYGPPATASVPTASAEELAALIELLAACAATSAAAAGAAALDSAATSSHHPAVVTGGAGGAPWAAGPEARAARASRLQLLAAYEWAHEQHLLQALPVGDPRVGQALAQFFAAQAADPLQPSSRLTAPSRLALLTQLQAALDALPPLEQAVSGWEGASGGAVSQVVALLRGAPEQFPVDTALAAQRAGVLMGRRQQWLAESRALAMRVCQVAEAVLQFEYSRQGITWAPGGAAVTDGFASHERLLGRAEVLAKLAAGGSEAGRAVAVAEASQRAAEAAKQAADARYTLEVAQYEEVAASSQLQAHLPQLASRSLDLLPAVVEMEPAVSSLVQLLTGKLGPALKELSSVAAQHSAASDVISVAAVVTSHFERSRQAAEALAEALPATVAAIAAVDAAAPLPADMATEVGFLSAQLCGGAAAAAVINERALALMQHMAGPTAALQPVVHMVTELPRGVAQLSAELSTLAAAASSIAAAVESKHVLPALDDQQPTPPPPQQQQQQAQSGTATPLPDAEAGLSPVGGGTAPGVATPGAGSTQAAACAAEGASVVQRLTPDGADAPAGLRRSRSHTGTGTGYASSEGPAAAAAAGAPTGSGPVRPPPPPRLASAAAAGVVAPEHVQHHRSRRSAADEARRRAFAAGALRRFVAKLEGREVDSGPAGAAATAGAAQTAPGQTLAVSEQVEVLVRQATSTDRLSQMYEGWAAWL